MDRQIVESLLSIESVAMFTVSALVFILSVSCIVCLYFVHRCYKVKITPHTSEVDHHPTSAGFNNIENEPTNDIITQSRSLTSSPSRKLKVIIERQEEYNSSIAELQSDGYYI